MKNSTDIIMELEEVAPALSQVSREMPFKVPGGYFENFLLLLMDQLHDFDRTDTVPIGYFESFPGLIADRIKAMEVSEELETVAPLLNSINKKPVQSVPLGYFNDLRIKHDGVGEQAIVAKIPVVKTWIGFAIAAAIAVLIGIAVINKVERPVLINQPLNVGQELAKIQDSTIENYLKKLDPVPEANLIAFQEVKDEDIQGFLQEFSEEELQQHLKQEGEASRTN